MGSHSTDINLTQVRDEIKDTPHIWEQSTIIFEMLIIQMFLVLLLTLQIIVFNHMIIIINLIDSLIKVNDVKIFLNIL